MVDGSEIGLTQCSGSQTGWSQIALEVLPCDAILARYMLSSHVCLSVH